MPAWMGRKLADFGELWPAEQRVADEMVDGRIVDISPDLAPEEVPPEESTWEGECFVFDNRVAVNHALEKGQYDQCHGCRRPITEEDKQSPYYMKGVCCPHCHDRLSPDQRARFAERQKQIELAQQRGEVHVGAPPPARQAATEGRD